MARYSSDSSISSDDDEEIVDFIQRPARRPRKFQERNNLFDMYDDVDFITRFRLSKQSVGMVLNHIEDSLEFHHDRNKSLSPINQLLLTLRFFATGCHLISAGDFIGVSKSTACRVVRRVTESIAALRPIYVSLPADEDEVTIIQREFYQLHRFPRVVGAMDCTHIKVQSPGGNTAEVFRNRKGYFSINVQTISDAKLQIRDIVARWPGSVHDSQIFNNCEKRAMFEAGQYGNGILLVDSGYPVRPYLMPPVDNARTLAEQRYNESQIRTRTCVERQYGVWKRMFPILALGMRVQIPLVLDIIVACAVLFNIARNNGDEPPDPLDVLNLQARIDEDQMPTQRQVRGALEDPRRNANAIRNLIINKYFNSIVERE